MKRYALRSGEPLAISPDAIKRDADGFFFMFGPETPENEVVGSCVVVHIRGALAHFQTRDGDSYEAIVERVREALARKPSHVVLRIESPGGVVAGLNEAVRKLRKMSADAGIPLVAFVDEMAASAAYAICCACDERLAPPSAVVGSVGVISTMASQARKDAADGIDFVLITSGKRKADGHPHALIATDAVTAERARNTQLAAQFFELASQATGLSTKRLAGLEAGIFLGDEAKRVGLIDEVIAFDAAMALLDDGTTPTDGTEDVAAAAPNEGNQTDRSESLDNAARSVSVSRDASHLSDESRTEEPMSVKLAALVAKMAKETDPTKVTALLAEYGMVSKAEKSDDDDNDDDDDDKKDDDDDDGDEDSKAKKAAAKAVKDKAKAKGMAHRAKASEHRQKAAEEEEAAEAAESEGDEEGDEEKKASLRAAPALALTPGALAALQEQAARLDALEKAAEKRDKVSALREQTAMIEEARAQRRITPSEAKTLAKKDASFVRDFLEMRPKALVAVTEESLEQPDGSPAADIPANVKAIVEQGLSAAGLTGEKADKYREESYAAHRKAMSNTNGAGVY